MISPFSFSVLTNATDSMFIFCCCSPYVLVCLFAYSEISHFVAIPFFIPLELLSIAGFWAKCTACMFSINNSLVSVSKHFLSEWNRLSLFEIGQRFKYTPVILKLMLILCSACTYLYLCCRSRKKIARQFLIDLQFSNST